MKIFTGSGEFMCGTGAVKMPARQPAGTPALLSAL